MVKGGFGIPKECIFVEMEIVLKLFILSIGASFVQRTAGFGFGIFIMTMLPAILGSYGEATTLYSGYDNFLYHCSAEVAIHCLG